MLMHDIDAVSRAPDAEDEDRRAHDPDPARAPRGLLIGLALGAGFWATVAAALLLG